MTDPTRSLVVPFRDEARRIPALLGGVAGWAARPGHEVVFADDGSHDGGPERVQAWIDAFREERPHAHLQLVSLRPGQGKGGAVRAGVLAARGERVAFTDTDLPYGLDAVDRLLDALDDADVVVGARDLESGSDAHAPPMRRLASVVFRTWVSLWVDTGDVTDTQCGVKAFRRGVAQDLFQDLSCRGFAFDIELLGLAQSRRLRVRRLPVQLRDWDGSSLRLRTAAPRLLLDAVRAGRAVSRRGRPD